MHKGLDDFVNEVVNVKDLGILRDRFSKFVGDLGFSTFAYVGLHLPPHELPHPLVVSTYPDQWQTYYIETDLDKIDPVLTQCMRSMTPFTWDGLLDQQQISKRQRAIFFDASDIGLLHGLTVPIHGYGAEFGLLSVTSDATQKEFAQVTRRFLHELHIAALYYHTAVKNSLDAEAGPRAVVRLSPREMECLLWASHGKTSWETAEILKISENTVNFHLKSAMAKLGVYNKRQAVVKAIMLALICP